MKILFFPRECCPFHGGTLEERPLGGTETAVIRLAKSLHSLDQEVFVVTDESEILPANPRYIKEAEIDKHGPYDAVIVVRDWHTAFHPFPTKKVFLWTGDNWDNPHTFGIGDPRIAKQLAGLFSVSGWHAQTLSRTSGFPREKIFILPNGVHLANFEGEVVRRKRLIYTATPERGLVHLLSIFPALKKKHPDLELVLFSSFDRYIAEIPVVVPNDRPYYPLYQKLAQLPGCTLHQSVLQKELAGEFMQSAIFVYPSHFEETCCMSALEAQAAGCPIVTSDLAALKETVGEAGFLIPGDPHTQAYQSQFIEACDTLLSDPALFDRYSIVGKKQAQAADWKNRAKLLLTYLRGEKA